VNGILAPAHWSWWVWRSVEIEEYYQMVQTLGSKLAYLSVVASLDPLIAVSAWCSSTTLAVWCWVLNIWRECLGSPMRLSHGNSTAISAWWPHNHVWLVREYLSRLLCLDLNKQVFSFKSFGVKSQAPRKGRLGRGNLIFLPSPQQGQSDMGNVKF